MDDLPDAQGEDLAFLLSLVPDPFDSSKGLSKKERTWLRRRAKLFEPGARAWLAIDNAEDGRLALGILAGS